MSFLHLPRNTVKTRLSAFFNADQDRLFDEMLPPNERLDRIRYFADKPLEWMTTYLPNDFTSECSDYHPQMVDYLNIRGRLVVIIIFRNAGKGTVLKGYTAHAIAYGKEPYLTRMEHDGGTASNEFLDLAREFKTNPRIIGDYGMMTGDLYGLPWRERQGEVFFKPPAFPEINHTPEHEFVYIRYVGLDSLIRGGVTLNRKRIGRLIVNDAVKGYVEAHSVSHTIKTVNTIKADAGFAGGSYKEKPISVSIIGTCQASGDAIDVLREDPMSKVLALPAIQGNREIVLNLMSTINNDIPNIREYVDKITDEGRNDTTEDHQRYIADHAATYAPFLASLTSIWDARFPLCDCIFMAAAWGTELFMQEMQHESADVGTQKFQASWFKQYDGAIPDDLTPDNHYDKKTCPLKYALTIDVSGQPKEGTDPMAIYAGAYHTKLKNLYTMHYWCDQSTPDDLVINVYEIFWQCFPWYRHNQRGVTVYLEDTVSYSGIGKAHFQNTARKFILAVHEEWEQKIEAAEQQPTTTQKDIDDLRTQMKQAVNTAKAYWCKLPIVLLDPKKMGNKLEGIAALRPVAQHGQLWYVPGHSEQDLWVKQFVNHRGKHTHGNMPKEFKNEGPDVTRMFFHTLKTTKILKPIFGYGDKPT